MPDASVVKAAESALQETQRRLFPIQGHRWLALGFIAFLDQCGQGVGSFNFHSPGGQTSGGGLEEQGEAIKNGLERASAYLSSHIALVMAGVALFLVFLLALWALLFWLRSRGTFMYIDNVATGRSDVRRPWQEHAGRADSYFAWLFGVQVAQLALLLLLLVPLIWGIGSLFRRGFSAGPLVAIAAAVFLLLVTVIGVGCFCALLRDFVAPLQWYTSLSCGRALRMFWGILAAHPWTFAVYLLLKLVYTIAVWIVGMIVYCLLCCGLLTCCGLLPTLQIVLQPVFYFERRWSLELLHQLGYAPPDAAPSPSV
jgi:hypothetical protein